MSSLSSTVAQAVSFLTRPLVNKYSPSTVAKLQLVLEANLTALYAPSWDVSAPRRGSGRRCLTLSPECLPPRAVYAACIAAGVQWFDWAALLGGSTFELFVDPGAVVIRIDSQIIPIWADQTPVTRRKTAAQLLIEDDSAEDEQIFSLLAHEIRAPTWMTPVLAEFPDKPRPSSRCSSRSSDSSSGFSFSSSDSSHSTSASSVSADDALPKQSRRERARQARVYIDTSKKEVTPYDSGKTTVLTGGVMLGAKRATSNSTPTHAWRTPRF